MNFRRYPLSRCLICKWWFYFALLAPIRPLSSSAQSSPQLEPLTPAQLWQRLEFRITNVPAVANPFDPNLIRLDATFTLPSGRMMTVPGFWYQAYQRAITSGSEAVTATGSPEWRIRFTPPEPGAYSVSLMIQTNGQISGTATATTNFTVALAASPKRFGYVRSAANREYFETTDGQPLRLIGENVAWPGGRGTYDYDGWFASMQAAGENYARIWMCPWWLGLETDANSLTHYRLDHAWQLDYCPNRYSHQLAAWKLRRSMV